MCKWILRDLSIYWPAYASFSESKLISCIFYKFLNFIIGVHDFGSTFKKPVIYFYEFVYQKKKLRNIVSST